MEKILSQSIAKLMPDLIKAQNEMSAVKKEGFNPFFNSSYADLNSIINECVPVLNKNGIAVLQVHDGNSVLTMLTHKSGEYITSRTEIVCAKQNDPQALGSAISYATRYGLQSIICLPSEDDDGESAMKRKPKSRVKSSGNKDF